MSNEAATTNKTSDVGAKPPAVDAKPAAPQSELERMAGYPAEWRGLKATPLATPGFTQLKTKNQSLAFRWVNRGAGNGLRVSQMLSVGFTIATPVDVEVPGLEPVENKFTIGDLVLMKISKDKYNAALKYNDEMARHRVSRQSHKQQAGQALNTALNEIGATPELKAKIAMFMLSDEEADALLGGPEEKPRA